MSKKPVYNYTTKNDLNRLIRYRQAELTVEHGRKYLIRDIEQDLANYCDVSLDYVKALKRGLSQPSLAVALKIAEYFKKEVDEVFTLIEKGD